MCRSMFLFTWPTAGSMPPLRWSEVKNLKKKWVHRETPFFFILVLTGRSPALLDHLRRVRKWGGPPLRYLSYILTLMVLYLLPPPPLSLHFWNDFEKRKRFLLLRWCFVTSRVDMIILSVPRDHPLWIKCWSHVLGAIAVIIIEKV